MAVSVTVDQLAKELIALKNEILAIKETQRIADGNHATKLEVQAGMKTVRSCGDELVARTVQLEEEMRTSKIAIEQHGQRVDCGH